MHLGSAQISASISGFDDHHPPYFTIMSILLSGSMDRIVIIRLDVRKHTPRRGCRHLADKFEFEEMIQIEDAAVF